MLAGLDTNVLIDIRVLRAGPVLARILAGEGWTTAFVDQEFTDPLEETERGVGRLFPFIEVDPVDGRLLPRIERDQIAIAGQQKATAGSAAGEASLIHAALASRPGSIVLSNDPHAVGLGRRRGVSVRGTLYIIHSAFSTDLLTAEEAWTHYRVLLDKQRRPPLLTRSQLNSYLVTGTDPR